MEHGSVGAATPTSPAHSAHACIGTPLSNPRLAVCESPPHRVTPMVVSLLTSQPLTSLPLIPLSVVHTRLLSTRHAPLRRHRLHHFTIIATTNCHHRRVITLSHHASLWGPRLFSAARTHQPAALPYARHESLGSRRQSHLVARAPSCE
jgi:hypothetical protein